jgi:hypothetical protein
MVAAQQFFNPAFDTLSADGTGAQKIIVENLKNTIALLANVADGSVAGTTTLNAATGGTSNINSAVSMNATPEPGKISLLANIMAACVDNASATATPCTTLFNAAVPPVPNTTTNNPVSYAKAKDTLQALFYMLTNPTSTAAGTSNMSTIFGLAGGLSGPYQPALNTQPTDWTVAINYNSTSTCGTPTGGTGGFISGPADIGIDNADNLWIANSQASTGNLVEISAAGIPTVCLQVGSGGSKSGGVVDINGNIWTGAGNSVYRYNPSLKTMLAMPAGVAVLGVTTDGNGNIYFSSTNGSLYELPNGTAAPSAVTPVQISSTVGTYPIRLMPDFQGEVNKVAEPKQHLGLLRCRFRLRGIPQHLGVSYERLRDSSHCHFGQFLRTLHQPDQQRLRLGDGYECGYVPCIAFGFLCRSYRLAFHGNHCRHRRPYGDLHRWPFQHLAS